MKKSEEQKFEDLPKKVQKKILRELWMKSIRPVEDREIENGTIQILNYIKNHPNIERKEISESLGFTKKKVKRILNRLSEKMIKRNYQHNELRYEYIGNRYLSESGE